MKRKILIAFLSIFLLLIVWNCSETPSEPDAIPDNSAASFYPVMSPTYDYYILPDNSVTDFSYNPLGILNSEGNIIASDGITIIATGIDKYSLIAVTPAGFLIYPNNSVTDINGTFIGTMNESGLIVLPDGSVYTGAGEMISPPTTILSSSTEIPLSSSLIIFSSSSQLFIPVSSSVQIFISSSSSPIIIQSSSSVSSSSVSSSSSVKSSSSVSSSSTQTSQNPNIVVVQNGKSGSGYATRYWDSCKPHCAWEGKGGPVARTCHADGSEAGSGETSVCDGGNAGTCLDQTPIIVNTDYAYAFAATPGGGNDCGKCYMLTFKGTGASATGTPTDDAHKSIKGKKLIVMSNNIGYDVSNGQFDLMIPGGGPGQYNGCGQMGISCAGAQYGGFLTTCDYKKDCLINMCNQEYANKPTLKEGCLFLANWMNAANNPEVDYVEVECPSELTSKY